ncbi:hypothetical protein [Actinoplanes sp. NPDC026623]|uniref:hypothetical protein n=1 Tax=Actinoplanes sp. NPDC026623 TaxID=3155610 RepID=UPI0033C6E321
MAELFLVPPGIGAGAQHAGPDGEMLPDAHAHADSDPDADPDRTGRVPVQGDSGEQHR